MMPNWKEMKPSVIFVCDNIEHMFHNLTSKGVKFTQEPKNMAWGTYAIFTDIYGNEFVMKGEF